MKLTEIANEEYYNTGDPILRDQEYDLLADNGLEMKNFRNKAKHMKPMGSLKKIKTREDYEKWNPNSTEMRVTPKLDGNSVELIVNSSGEVVQAITRGDGYEGSDITDKIHHCNIVDIPEEVRCMPFCSIACEAIMPKKFQSMYTKNIRNVVAGLLGKKEIEKAELGRIDIIPFSVLPVFVDMVYEDLEKTFDKLKNDYPYEIDGLVVEMVNGRHKETDELIPANKVALKFNKEGVSASVGYLEWNLGKYGRLTPVIVLDEPVEIDGTTVSRVSASNYGIVKEAGLGLCAEIKVIKSGDIIPFVSEVVNRSDILPPVFCPNCQRHGSVSDNGVHMICTNCANDRLTFLKHCFGVFDLEYISESTIELLYKNGYNSLIDYFNMSVNDLMKLDGIGKSKANNIISKIKNIKLTPAQVLECAMIQGLGNKQAQKLIDHFGSMDKIDYNNIQQVEGFGPILAERIKNLEAHITECIGFFKQNVIIIEEVLTKTEFGYTIVCTGTAPVGRKELIKQLESMGHIVESGVTKNTTLLLTNDPDSNSGKTKKAKELGIEIKTYEEFLKGD